MAGAAQRGSVINGTAGPAKRGMVKHSLAWHGRRGNVRRGKIWLGADGQGRAERGPAGWVRLCKDRFGLAGAAQHRLVWWG
jgi:hypothetical protein